MRQDAGWKELWKPTREKRCSASLTHKDAAGAETKALTSQLAPSSASLRHQGDQPPVEWQQCRLTHRGRGRNMALTHFQGRVHRPSCRPYRSSSSRCDPLQDSVLETVTLQTTVHSTRVEMVPVTQRKVCTVSSRPGTANSSAQQTSIAAGFQALATYYTIRCSCCCCWVFVAQHLVSNCRHPLEVRRHSQQWCSQPLLKPPASRLNCC